MNLLTLNCHSWQEDNQLDKIKVLARIIKDNKYDVIALQEVSQIISGELISKLSKENYISILLEALKALGETSYKCIWDFSHIGYDIYEEGLAIITRHKIKEWKSFYVSKDTNIKNYKTRKIIEVKIEVNNKDYKFYSCHLGWWDDLEEPFKDQVDKLIDSLDKKYINIIMGDFNNDALIRNEGYDYLLSKGLFDTYYLAREKGERFTVEGKIDGWEDNKSSKVLDFILVNEKVNVVESKIIFNNKNEVKVSDHYGVQVKIEV
ncbi:endonuclease/exonuclease/phosphatase family protein [Clostridium septicum]|uniref:Endonuclease n=1 Tax=Clostridium septicum TaxID=1504 RepID=A0A9N7JJR0_CLOSE|nr:endonuclease/exonuclease/phosphatase family protein [Clostridium septicum]AYE33625.1 endonuclease [Clostridium septicum]QAS61789.1 endonuclease [Clostridium septicum]UEC21762.1 endonuclease/exonuclease/phosphatase family protein [Clostridium septicum]USS00185.1 endonuclease/exonuclease/phosphatase family protein [Clostridium septicum]